MSSSDRYELRSGVPILRLFKARARPSCESALAEKLATSSVQVVRDEPGFLGFLCAGPANNTDRDFVFASMWRDVDAIKARFGHDWRVSFLPPGYAELIEEFSVEHYHLTERSFPG
jgi:quinol monooxygenase YgiN